MVKVYLHKQGLTIMTANLHKEIETLGLLLHKQGVTEDVISRFVIRGFNDIYDLVCEYLPWYVGSLPTQILEYIVEEEGDNADWELREAAQWKGIDEYADVDMDNIAF